MRSGLCTFLKQKCKGQICLQQFYYFKVPRISLAGMIESREIISMDESKEIIQTFFKVRFSFKKLLERHRSNHRDSQIKCHVNKIFMDMLFDIEKELMLANKIKTMRLYEHKCEEMSAKLMNLQEILYEDDLISDFTIYYRNRVSRVTVYQSDLIPSENRLSIYNKFLQYAVENDLFRFCRVEKLIGSQVEFLEDPMTLYTAGALVVLYEHYLATDGNQEMIERNLRKQGKYKSYKYEGEPLRQNILNLLLIGFYRMYKTAMRHSMKPCSGWQTFSSKYIPQMKKVPIEWRKILMRVSVYDDAKVSQVQGISKLIARKFAKKRSYTISSDQEANERIPQNEKQQMPNSIRTGSKKVVGQNIKDPI